MGTGFVMVENLFRGHPPGEHPLHRKPCFIRVILKSVVLFSFPSEREYDHGFHLN